MRLGKAQWKTLCDLMIGKSYVHNKLGTVRVVSVSPETEEGVVVCSALNYSDRTSIALGKFIEEFDAIPVVSFDEMFGIDEKE